MHELLHIDEERADQLIRNILWESADYGVANFYSRYEAIPVRLGLLMAHFATCRTLAGRSRISNTVAMRQNIRERVLAQKLVGMFPKRCDIRM